MDISVLTIRNGGFSVLKDWGGHTWGEALREFGIESFELKGVSKFAAD